MHGRGDLMTNDDRVDPTVIEQSTYENSATARRVTQVDKNGLSLSTPGRTFKYEDISFQTGESPITLDVNTNLGRNATDGYLICDGPGNILVEFSDDGSSFGGQHTLKKRDKINLKNLNIDKIRITWITNSAYRILVV